MSDVIVCPARVSGEISPPSSKSHIHRLMIISALSGNPLRITGDPNGDDIAATARCLTALGVGIERDGNGSLGLALGFGKRDFIKRAALIAAWLCACAAFIYTFSPDYTLAQAGDILRGEGYRGVRSAGFAVRDWESENPFVAYMPVFEAAPAGGSAEYLAVSLETGGISPAAPLGGGK